jgi:hypothetical protein
MMSEINKNDGLEEARAAIQTLLDFDKKAQLLFEAHGYECKCVVCAQFERFRFYHGNVIDNFLSWANLAGLCPPDYGVDWDDDEEDLLDDEDDAPPQSEPNPAA